MYADKFSSAGEAIQNLFDPRQRLYDCRSRAHEITPAPAAKQLYLQHSLMSRWKEICGPHLADKCSIQKIEGQELYVSTANSVLANELYMMQSLFLQKVNSCLGGRLKIKKVYFHSGSLLRRKEKQRLAEEAPPPPQYTVCPRCGARMLKGLEICGVCDRQQREELRHKLAELLRIQPWLHYEDCRLYCPCDKILFTFVRDELKSYYCERVRLGFADKKESLLAVLFVTEKQPEKITPQLYENTLTYLRREQGVPAFRSGLYGKKQ